jgi:hypothetical protein
LKWSLEIAVGLIVISHTIFVATQLNLLSTLFLKLLFVCLSLLTAFSLFDSNWSKLLASIRHQLKEKPLNWGIILLSTCYLGWLVLNTALPPTAIDELTYHLEVPNRLIQTGGQTLFIDNVYAYFPQLADMFFLFGLGVGGEGGAR